MRRQITALLTLAILATLATPAAAANARSTLRGSVPPWATAANRQTAADPGEWVNFRVYLGLRDQRTAEALALAVSDPNSPSYGQFLTTSQFNDRFAPSASDVAAVSSWLQGQGLAVDFVPSNNHYVAAEGTVAQVQTAFGAQLARYSVNGKSLRAPSSDLMVPGSLAGSISGVIGIDQSSALITPFTADAPPPGGFRNAGPCSTYWDEKDTATTPVQGQTLPTYNGSSLPFAPCGYAGAQLQTAYGVASAIASGNDGRGVTVAVIDAYASPTIVTDSSTYFANHGLPAWQPGQFTQIVAPGTYNHPESPAQDPQGWSGEETLDVEAVHTMAPGANVVYVGAPNNYQDLDAALNHVVARHTADIVTNSYGFSSEFLPPGYIKPYNDTFVQAALEGIGIYFSSGDSGDETFGSQTRTATPDWPASSPWVTAVGGTSLAVGQNNANLFEVGWGTKRNRLNHTGLLKTTGTNAWDPAVREIYLYGAGGGTSHLFAQPAYQQGVVPSSLATRWSSTPARVVPDIAAVGDPNTGMLIGQTQTFSDTGTQYGEYRIGGTSLSSPLMAGIMAVAQQRKGSNIGFANPTIYTLPASAFNDIVDPASPIAVVRADYKNGENATDGILYSVRTTNVTWTLHTVAGYDDVTGRGTPNGTFLSAIAGH